MTFQAVRPEEWLTDSGLTDAGREAREAYRQFCDYLDAQDLLSYQSARAKYFLQYLHYWTLPEGYSLPPHTINLCVNNICNLKCSYCDFGMKREETFYYKYNVVDDTRNIELPYEALTEMIDRIAWARPIIRASYREPMLYKRIMDLIAHTKKAGLPFWLLTNGFNLRRHARRMVELNIDSVRLSLDGPEDVHDAVCRVPGAYRRMMEGVKELIAAREDLGADTQVGFYFTITHDNYNRILATVQALEDEGVLPHVFVNFQWLLYTTKEMAEAHNREHGPICGGYVDESTVQTVHLDRMDLGEMSRQARETARRYPASAGYRIHFRPSFEMEDLTRYVQTTDFPIDRPRCRVPWYDLTVNPGGDVRSFHHCLLPPVGNMLTTPLLDVWNGEAMRAQRRGLQEHGAYRGCARCWGVYALLEDRRRQGEGGPPPRKGHTR